MTQSIFQELKNQYKAGSVLIKFIMINATVWLVLIILAIIFWLMLGEAYISASNEQILNAFYIMDILAVPASLQSLLYVPWTLFTYMFVHVSFWHILFNMLWLFIFGRIFLEYLSNKQFISTYILGGLFGGIMFILAYNIFPVFSSSLSQATAIGASASVTAIVIAISFYVPNYEIKFIFLPPIKLKYIAIFFIITDIIQIKSANSGGHLAHLGGAIWGILYIAQLKQGKDFSVNFFKFLNSISGLFKTRKKTKLHVSYRNVNTMSDEEYNKMKHDKQKKIDEILDKISKSGYESLTKNEKDFLFNHTK